MSHEIESKILTLLNAESFDPRAAIEAVRIAAGRAEAMLTSIRHELERSPWIEADPDLTPAGGVRRVEVMDALLEGAECDVRLVRQAISKIAERLARGG